MTTMRTVNLKTGNPFVIEDTLTTEYQSILNMVSVLKTASDRTVLWIRTRSSSHPGGDQVHGGACVHQP